MSNAFLGRRSGAWPRPDATPPRYTVAQRLGTVSRFLAATTRTDPRDGDRLVSHFVAFLDALRLALDALRADEGRLPDGEALALELEALVLRPAAPDVPALADIGMRAAGPTTWEVAYLELEYQLQRRPAELLAAAKDFERRFRDFHAAVSARLDPTAA